MRMAAKGAGRLHVTIPKELRDAAVANREKHGTPEATQVARWARMGFEMANAASGFTPSGASVTGEPQAAFGKAQGD